MRARPSGVVVVDKPEGPTSHDVVALVRRKLKTRQVGHAGTLDPMATGVLVVAVGEATKLVSWLTADDKEYEATIRLGVATDTLDRMGRESARAPIDDRVVRAIASGEGSDALERALTAERARAEQIPPAFSAIRIGGERAHDLARTGRLDADLPSRPIAVRSLDIIGGSVIDDVVALDVRLAVAKGYFVRALARDLAHALGTVGHLTRLRRTRSGAFTAAADAISLDAVSPEALIPVATAAARALPVTVLDELGVRAASYGQRVAAAYMQPPAAPPGPSAWLDASSRLIAVGERTEDGSGRVLRGFAIDEMK